MKRAMWIPWLAIAAVLAISLAIGSGLGQRAPMQTPKARVAMLEGELRCPSCVDLSVAASDAPIALYIRRYVVSQVRAGASDRAIISFLESRYGPSVLLTPPTSASGSAIWWLPGMFIAVVIAGAIWRLSRRQPVPMVRSSASDQELVRSALLRRHTDVEDGGQRDDRRDDRLSVLRPVYSAPPPQPKEVDD